jgi:cyclophilin family peptidyl-prolyl cis-trans isomerase/HEAT repeat protein
VLVVLVAVSPGAVAQQRGPALRPHAAEWSAVLAAEDARARTAQQREVLVAATRSPEPELRRIAVRALGRLERAELVASIEPLLRDGDARVRAAAAHALGQAVHQQDDHAAIRESLVRALAAERVAAVRAAIAETLGRTRHTSTAQAAATLGLIVALLDENATARLGAVRGVYFLARQQPVRAAFDAASVAPVRALITDAGESADPDAARVRALAVAALVSAGLADQPVLAAALTDLSPLVRREAVLGTANVNDTVAAARLVARALDDEAGMVRYDAVRTFARRLAATHGCEPVRAAARDADAHVALYAIGLLGTACDVDDRDIAFLDTLTVSPADRNGDWHRSAHALLALAMTDTALASGRLPAFVAYPNYFVRSYAARAATALRDDATLRRLATDAHPNVRAAAVRGLRTITGRDADDVYLAQLELDDSQLLQASASALEGSERADAADALLDAFDRISAARRETSRDGRRALLVRVRELGRERHAARVQPYLRDFDPQIAALAAEILEAWTGARPAATPVAPRALPLPTFEEIAALDAARLVITFADGGEVELRLHAFDAPTNVARFVRLARAGYYDGLTFHRVVPNFVVQGGSPNANEYAGDGPFTRDELGRANWRGTVGLSTRGRDTGDAQLYINLVDNVRLDPDYTVWAEVGRGMDVVDRIQEGAVIVRVRLRPAP